LGKRTPAGHPTKKKTHRISEEPKLEKDAKSPSKSSEDAAAQKAEELRTALQSKGEQGKSSLSSLPVDED
jgi:hypothetical protein